MTEVAPERADGLPDRVGVNAAMNYLAALAALSAFVITPYILRHLGVAAFGVWSLAASVGVYADLFRFGFGTAGISLIAREADRGPERVRALLNTTIFLLVPPAIAALVIGLTISFLSPRLFRVPDGLHTETIIVFLVLALAVTISLPLDPIASGLAGYQRYDLLAAVSVVGTLVTSVLSVAVVALGGGVVALTIVSSSILLLMHLARWRLLKRLVPGLAIAPRYIDRSAIRSTSRLSGWFSIRELADLLIHSTDIVVVGTVLGVRAAAVYAIGTKLARFARMGAQPISKLFFPHASSLADGRDPVGLRALVTDGSRAVLLVGLPVCLTLTIFARPIVHAWVGPGYGTAAVILALLASAQAVFGFTETIWFVVSGAHHPRPAAIVTIIEASVNVGLSVLLAHHMGATGVALATLIAVLAIDLPAAFVLILRYTDMEAATIWRRTFRPHLAPTAGCALVLVAARPLVPLNGVGVVATCAVAFLAYLAIYVGASATPAERDRVRRITTGVRGRLART